MTGTRSHRPDLGDASAQSDLICAPQPTIFDQTQAAPIGGYRVQGARRTVTVGDEAAVPGPASQCPAGRSRPTPAWPLLAPIRAPTKASAACSLIPAHTPRRASPGHAATPPTALTIP